MINSTVLSFETIGLPSSYSQYIRIKLGAIYSYPESNVIGTDESRSLDGPSSKDTLATIEKRLIKHIGRQMLERRHD